MSSPVLNAQRLKYYSSQGLSTKEVLYCDNRLSGSPPAVAARMAGLPNPDEESKRLEKSATVRKYMEASIQVETHNRGITRDDVLAGLMDATNMASTATELVAAWREIGKIIGAYEPKKVDVNITDTRQLQEQSDEDLARLAAIDGEYQVLDFEGTDDLEPTEGPAKDGPIGEDGK